MKTWLTVARYHLVQRFNYLVLPWLVLAFVFAVDVVVIELTPAGHTAHRWVGGLAAFFVVLFVLGLQAVAQSLPFGLALGASRRSFYLGTSFLGVALAAVYGLALTGLQAIERATGGWGIDMGFFRVPYLLNGSWYTTWLPTFVAGALLFAWGMWFGLVFRRWGTIGVVAFGAAQIVVLLLGALLTTWTRAWHDLGHFFTTISAPGLTGLLAALAIVLLVGGFATMRRVTV
jgi:hypothetical protein